MPILMDTCHCTSQLLTIGAVNMLACGLVIGACSNKVGDRVVPV